MVIRKDNYKLLYIMDRNKQEIPFLRENKNGPYFGKYTSNRPIRAVTKAYSECCNHMSDTQDELILFIERTNVHPKWKRKVYMYTVKRNKLKKPIEVQRENGKKIQYYYNVVALPIKTKQWTCMQCAFVHKNKNYYKKECVECGFAPHRLDRAISMVIS